jgi:hypothetical protein
MLDAATMSSGDRQPEMLLRKVFQRIDVRYPPEVLHARYSVRSQVWVMSYLVVQPLFGVRSGPDFMYWGSKTIRGATRIHRTSSAGTNIPTECHVMLLHRCPPIRRLLIAAGIPDMCKCWHIFLTLT